MWVLALTAIAFLVSGTALAQPLAQPPKLVTEELAVQSTDPRIRLYVRNKHPADIKAFVHRTVLFIHDEIYPGEASFDLNLGGVSWMDYVAGRGFDAYLVDLRGYGRSGRPSEMLANPADHPPLVRSAAALDDIAVAVETILARRRIAKLSLVGQSWGATLAAAYAAQNPARVERLVLAAPHWTARDGGAAARNTAAPGAYRLISREQVFAQRFAGVPESRRRDLFPAGWFEAFQDAAWASDPLGASSGQPLLRAPAGALADLADVAAGKAPFDPAKITMPALLAVGEWDVDTPPYMAQNLLSVMVNAPGRRVLIVPQASHAVFLERSRNALLQAVQIFLEEQAKP